MIELLRQHIEEIYRNHDENDLSEIKPYLKDDKATSIPLDVEKLVLLVPDMLQELVDLMMAPETPQLIRALASGIYSYVFNPLDYIPDHSGSIVGFLDDALVLFYGLHFIEQVEPSIQTTIVHKEEIADAIGKAEGFLSDSIISSIKEFPTTVHRSIRVE